MVMLKAVRSLGTGATGSSGCVMWMSGGGGSESCCTRMSVCKLSWLPPGPWVPVTLYKEGGNSDAAAVIDDAVDPLREAVGHWGAIDFHALPAILLIAPLERHC